MFHLNDLWLGDQASLREMVALESRALAAATQQPQAGMVHQPGSGQQPGEARLPRLYSRHANVGIVTIKGSLINQDGFFAELFGLATYPAIREALAFAASDERVDQILLDIESPGGSVSGVNDTAALVRGVRNVKPVTAFSDGLMASAAYWIGSAADKIYVGETAIVGSIGVIATLVSVHDAMKKEGVDARVVRAGKNKALGHPMEPLNDKAIAQVQERADAIYDVFTETVTRNRSKLKKDKKDEWAEGNEFLGADAVSSGLADAVSSFDKVLAQLTVDNENFPNNNASTKTRGFMMSKPRAALPADLVAKIQAGAELTAEEQAAKAAAETPEAIAAAEAAAAAAKVEADKAAADAAKAAADKAAADKAAADAALAASAAEAAKKSELVAYLEGQVTAKNTENAALAAEVAALKKQVTDLSGPQTALVDIAKKSINVMTIGLGGHALALDALSPAEVVAKHAAVLGDFTKAFPTSAVASTTPAPEKNKDAAPVADPLRVVALASVRNLFQPTK